MDDNNRNLVLKGLLSRCSSKQIEMLHTLLNLNMAQVSLYSISLKNMSEANIFLVYCLL